MQIQEYLICSIQNIQVLIKSGLGPKKASARALLDARERIAKNWGAVALKFGRFLRVVHRQLVGSFA